MKMTSPYAEIEVHILTYISQETLECSSWNARSRSKILNGIANHQKYLNG